MTALRAVALVGDQLRHRWYATLLADEPGIDLYGVVSERQPAQPDGATAEEDELVADHFARRRDAEERYLGSAREWDALGAPTVSVERGETNTQLVSDWVGELDPDLVLLYGCGIIRAPLLDAYVGRTVNLHLGLSPYYRGHAANFWPLVNGEPECVGATVHIATLDVDAGGILRQARPTMEPGDGSHDIGCKALQAGARALLDSLPDFVGGTLRPVPQGPDGRAYRHVDFEAAPGAAIAELRRRFAAGMIPAYLERKAERDARFPIVE